MPYPAILNSIKASVIEASVGSNIVIDINRNGAAPFFSNSILSTKLVIDAGSLTSIGSNTTPVISSNLFVEDDLITVDIDQIGSSVPGKGLLVTFEFIKQ